MKSRPLDYYVDDMQYALWRLLFVTIYMKCTYTDNKTSVDEKELQSRPFEDSLAHVIVLRDP